MLNGDLTFDDVSLDLHHALNVIKVEFFSNLS